MIVSRYCSSSLTSNVLGPWATMPDKVFRIDENGQLNLSHVRPHDTPDNELVSGERGNEPVANISLKTLPVTNNAIGKVLKNEDAVTTRITDKSVYKTYFNSIGTGNTIFFFVWGAVYAVAIKFPGKGIPHTSPSPLLTLCRCMGAEMVQR
jgi:hypothetical protein